MRLGILFTVRKIILWRQKHCCFDLLKNIDNDKFYFSLKNIFKKKFFFYWYFIKNVKKILDLYFFFIFKINHVLSWKEVAQHSQRVVICSNLNFSKDTISVCLLFFCNYRFLLILKWKPFVTTHTLCGDVLYYPSHLR